MAWTDFDYHASSAQIAAFLDPINVLVGVSSLNIRRVSGASVTYLNWAAGAGLTNGVARGRLRCKTQALGFDSNSHQFGLLCMMSQDDMSGGAGAAYGLRMRGAQIDIVKFSSGLTASPTLLITYNTGMASPWGNPSVIQLLWVADQQSVLGGTYLAAYHAVSTDFTALVQVAEYLDLSSPLTTSNNEGGFAGDFGAGSDFGVLFDSLRMEGP
jgi:hypothetical protein